MTSRSLTAFEVDNNNLGPAVYHTLTGNQFPGGGANAGGNGYLPDAYQGTLFRNGNTPIVDLNRPGAISEAVQRKEVDLLRWMDQCHSVERTNTVELDDRISSFELAFRMQPKAPELIDISGERDAM